ncbi:kelch repeat-containing protein [Mucilaginibacter sp. BT774]|uniref:Kelch repeat-containing protein n=1 Tax=Mucilaginibacter sp. BT774 TaxID=3062276 RepID=UPI00267693DE|nr:kelch repeat-containing protein [Mucilaginibacter sp. BT774]MDO3627465.1 kelch repeat-containing protein [Mucilaginibacter sp. BT774]
MKKILNLSLFLVIIMSACSKQQSVQPKDTLMNRVKIERLNSAYTWGQEVKLTIDSLNVRGPGDVTIDFGSGLTLHPTRTDTNSVYFNVPYTLVNNTNIFNVIIGELKSNDDYLTLMQPHVSAVNSSSVQPGRTMTITGQYFNPVLANNQVQINTTFVTVVSATPTQLVVKADNSIISDQGNLTIITGNGLQTMAYGNYTVYRYLTPRSDFPGPARFGATAVTINGNIYFGLGKSKTTNLGLDDWWKYDPNADKWTQIANCPMATFIASSFSIGSKVYVGVSAGLMYYNAFFCYDTVTDTWKPVASFPGKYALFPMSFSSGQYGYLVGGTQVSSGSNGGNTNDVWRYDPASDSWQQLAPFPGLARDEAIVFTLNNKGYVIGGGAANGGSNPYQADAWSFDFATETWRQLAAPPQNVPRSEGFAFSLQNKAYVGGGKIKDGNVEPYVYEYDPMTDTWSIKEKIFDPINLFSAAASVNGTGYVITGEGYFNFDFAGSQRFFQFKP